MAFSSGVFIIWERGPGSLGMEVARTPVGSGGKAPVGDLGEVEAYLLINAYKF